MSVFTRSSYGLLAIVMLAGSPGLLTRDAVPQERQEEATFIVVSEEASGDEPREARNAREREEGDAAEAKERRRSERRTERDALEQQVEVFKIALHGLLEADKKDAAEMLEHRTGDAPTGLGCIRRRPESNGTVSFSIVSRWLHL